MSIASEITRLQSAKASIKSALQAKGVTVGNETLDEYAPLISSLDVVEKPDLSDYTFYEAMKFPSIGYFYVPKLAFSTISTIKADFTCHRFSTDTKANLFVFSNLVTNISTGTHNLNTYANYRIITAPSTNEFELHYLHADSTNRLYKGTLDLMDHRVQVEFNDSYGKLWRDGVLTNVTSSDVSSTRTFKYNTNIPFVIGIPQGNMTSNTRYSFEGYIYSFEFKNVLNDFSGEITLANFYKYKYVDVLLKPALKISTQETCWVDVNSGKYYPLTGGTATLVNLS